MPTPMYVVTLPTISGSYDTPEQEERCIFTSDEAKAQALAASVPGANYYDWNVSNPK